MYNDPTSISNQIKLFYVISEKINLGIIKRWEPQLTQAYIATKKYLLFWVMDFILSVSFKNLSTIPKGFAYNLLFWKKRQAHVEDLS